MFIADHMREWKCFELNSKYYNIFLFFIKSNVKQLLKHKSLNDCYILVTLDSILYFCSSINIIHVIDISI